MLVSIQSDIYQNYVDKLFYFVPQDAFTLILLQQTAMYEMK